MTDKEINNIEDDYDLVVLIGKSMNDSSVSFKIKDAIKEIAKASFNIGYERAIKDSKKKDI